MKKKIVIAILAICLLMILNICLLFQIKIKKTQIQNIREKYSVLEDETQKRSWLLFQNMLCQYKNESIQLSNFSLKDHESLDSFPISSLLGDETVLFFRFRETNCDLCVNKFMELLKNIPNDFPIKHLVVLCGYSNIHEYKTFVRKNNLNISMFNVQELLSLPIEKLNEPYFFVLNPNLKIQNIFIPDKDNPRYMIDYLMCIKKKYWP